MNKTKQMIPLNNHIWIKVNPAEEKTSSGLYMAKNDSEMKNHGEVLAISPYIFNGKKVDCNIKVGDIVYFRPHSLIELEEDVYMIAIINIISKLEN